MKKKALSLALALALCLGLAVPAFAAGETTVKDSMGLAYTLSKPALGSKTIKADRMLELFGSQDTVTVYLVPEGTVIKPVIKPGTLSNAEARKFTGESEGDQYSLGYEIWDTSGQGGENLDAEGFELAWSGVQPIISQIHWAIPGIDNPNSPVHNNADGTDWISGVIGFEISEEKPADPPAGTQAKVGDTAVTITDSTGLTITLKLSNSIQAVETLAAGDGEETNVTVYCIPAGTTITPTIAGASWKDGIFNGDMLCNSGFVGKLSDGQTWEREYGVEFAGKKQNGTAGSWGESEYFSGDKALSAGVWEILCEHYYSLAEGDSVGTGRVTSRVYFRVPDEKPADPPAKPETASPTNDKLEVNGAAADPTVYKINGSNYFKIRDVAALLNGTEKQFAVGYDGTKNAVTATTGQGYAKQSGDLAGAAKGGNQNAAASNDAIYVNGEKITAEVYKIGGSNYFKLRDLGKALNFYVGWSAQRGMYIETDKPYSE